MQGLILKEQRDVQWIWGILSGFPKNISYECILEQSFFDLTMEQPYLKDELHHIAQRAVLEIVAFDSTETFVLFDEEELFYILKIAFPMAENLEKYIYTNDDK